MGLYQLILVLICSIKESLVHEAAFGGNRESGLLAANGHILDQQLFGSENRP